ncbi:MAG: helix-turn-helix transcriptional regulator [Flavobacteriaceae bacterium]|nr:helix-turn-helix transcriptional regulator [Flavobacteriaceae bacterium]
MKQPDLGLRITELRKQKGLTQDELVDRCNINVRTLQRIENGEVTPRSYTIKTILSALDYDFESLQAEGADYGQEPLLTIDAGETKSVHTLLTISWIAGILFAVGAFFEGFADYFQIEDGEFIYGQWGYVVCKVVVLLCNLLLLYGFLVSGKVLRNYLMKIATVLMMIAVLCFYTYDIVSVFYTAWGRESLFLAEGVTLGALGLLFGISILKSRQVLGATGVAAGVAEISMALCMISVLLVPLALFLFFPTVILEVVLLYKVSTLVKGTD